MVEVIAGADRESGLPELVRTAAPLPPLPARSSPALATDSREPADFRQFAARADGNPKPESLVNATATNCATTRHPRRRSTSPTVRAAIDPNAGARAVAWN